jgi:hypothetical protein
MPRTPRIPLSRSIRTRRQPLLIERLEDRTLLSGNLLIDAEVPGTVDYNLMQYTQQGALVSSQPVALAPGSTDFYPAARGLSEDPSGNVNIFDGTFNPYLATYAPATSSWSYRTYPGWSTVNNGSYGEVAAYRTFVFASDMFTFGGGEPNGIVRFDSAGSGTVRFASGTDFIQLTLGRDGVLYGLGAAVKAFNPDTLAAVRTFTLQGGPDSDIRSIAVDASGQMLAATWGGYLAKYDAGGHYLASIRLPGQFGPGENLNSVALDRDGQVAVGGRFGEIYLTDESLASVQIIQTNQWNVFVTFDHYIGTAQEVVTPAFASLAGPTIRAGQAFVTLGGQITAGAAIPPGSVDITLAGVTIPAAINPADGTFSAVFDTSTLGASGSPYPITYSYPGDTGYAAIQDTSKSLTVTPSTFIVLNLNDNGPGSLRQAILDSNAIPGADTIMFAEGLHGTIPLTSGELPITASITINGPGADQLAISGNHASRVFDISGGVTVTIAGLTITDGLAAQTGAPGQGGAIRDVGGTVTVADAVLSNNEARGVGAQGQGGAIECDSGARLTITNSQFVANLAHGVASGGTTAGAGGIGGAIQSVSATLTITGCTFSQNQAIGDNAANGGAINCTGSATVIDTTFLGNRTIGGSGGSSGFSRGGGMYNSSGTLTIENCTFTGNQAIGGSNNTGPAGTLGQASGGGVQNSDRGILFLSGSIFSGNEAIGGSNNTSTGGIGNIGTTGGGGLINVGRATVTDSLFEDNEARGGSANQGDGTSDESVGTAQGGGISTSAGNTSGDSVSLTLHNVTLRNNRAIGGDGNTAGMVVGRATGGGLSSSGANPFHTPSGGSTTTLSDSTITDNQAVGGHAAPGGNGRDALGGAIANFFGALLTVSGSTLTGNQALGGAGRAGGNGVGGGIFNDGPSTHPSNPGAPTSLTVLGSTLTDNEAEGGATGAAGSSAGTGAGGGISSAGILTLLGSTLAHNVALGHDGTGPASGGAGLGAGLYVAGGTASILNTLIQHNRAFGGDGDAGGNGGNGFGGGVYVGAGTVVVSASDISDNQAIGGLGDGAGTDGLGLGGGVYNLGTFLHDTATVIRHNRASDGNDDCFGC